MVCRQQQGVPRWTEIQYNANQGHKKIGYLVTTGSKNNTLLGMDAEILDDNNLKIGNKSYIQEDINSLMREFPQKYRLQKIKIYTNLIRTPLNYQRIRREIFTPFLQRFYV